MTIRPPTPCAIDPDESARAVIARIAAGDLSALEACNSAIERIESRDAAINAVVVRDFDRARASARACDDRLRSGERLPLMGLPMTVKDTLDVAGLPSTWGVERWRDFRPSEDSVVVVRLKAAGAVILGKTNVPPMLADWQASNGVYGRTTHPLNASLGPGGSSGGSAAAVAAGMVALEVGSDIGGSIRVPAAICGVFGHKPSLGLIPTRGHQIPGSDGAADMLNVVGPLARTADDLQLALDILSGPAIDDPWSGRLEQKTCLLAGLSGCRMLVLDAHPSVDTDSTIRRAIGRLADRAKAVGASVTTSSPLLPDLETANQAYVALVRTIFFRQRGLPAPIQTYDWFDALDQRARVQRQWHRLFADFDVVVAPAFGTLAYPHVDPIDMQTSTLMIDGERTRYGRQLAWPGVATLPGLPATAVPVGQSDDGLPIGVQVIGAYLGDRTTISVANWLNQLGN